MRLQLLQRAVGRGSAFRPYTTLHFPETLAEFLNRLLQCFLGIHGLEAAEIDKREEQVSDFFANLPLHSRLRGPADFSDFLFHLGQHFVATFPVEPHAGDTRLDTLRLLQSRQVTRNPLDDGSSIPLLCSLDGFPVPQHLRGVLHDHVTKNVRMAAYQLVRQAFRYVFKRKLALFLPYAGLERYLEQNVTKLLGMTPGVAAIDGIDEFIGLLDQVGLQGLQRLLAIPGTAAVIAETGHNVQESVEAPRGFLPSGAGHDTSPANRFEVRIAQKSRPHMEQ